MHNFNFPIVAYPKIKARLLLQGLGPWRGPTCAWLVVNSLFWSIRIIVLVLVKEDFKKREDNTTTSFLLKNYQLSQPIYLRPRMRLRSYLHVICEPHADIFVDLADRGLHCHCIYWPKMQRFMRKCIIVVVCPYCVRFLTESSSFTHQSTTCNMDRRGILRRN